MIRNLVFLAAILGCTISAPITTEKELMEFVRNKGETVDLLTAKEQDAVVKILKEKKVTSTEQAISTLKSELPAIYAKVEQTIAAEYRKIEALPEKAKDFIKYIENKNYESLGIIDSEKKIDEHIVGVLNKYDTLSVQDVVELKKYNPSYDFIYGEGGQLRNVLNNVKPNKIVQ